MTTVNELIKWLKKNYKGSEHVAYDLWVTDDIISLAKDKGRKITKDKANEVIDAMDDNKDAEQGLTWDTMSYWFDEIIENDEEIDKNE